ncbi:MAG: UDP-N-acetylmuramoyl-L-alanyl-D-glutamate--2,6-diaminopimelate ligase, partial [Psychrobacter alimentarius]
MTVSTSSLNRTTVTLQQLAESSNKHSLQQTLTAMIAASAQPPLAQVLSTQTRRNQQESIAAIPFHQFCLDSRQLKTNDVFVLLKSQALQSQALQSQALQSQALQSQALQSQ